MKVFISWSGGRSRGIADILRRWLPSVLQAVRPYFSPDDVAKGSRWSSEIAKELEASRVGVLIITPENQEAPWLLFEAGALAKNLERSKVCPLLFGDMEPTDVKGPLVQFQAAKFGPDEMKRVLKMINAELGDAALSPDVLESVFEMWWEKLSEQVEAELEADVDGDGEVRRSERDILEEVLSLARDISREGQRDRHRDLDHPVWDDLFASVTNLAQVARKRSPSEDVISAIARVVRPMEYLAHRELRGPSRRSTRRFGALLSELQSTLSAPEGLAPKGDSAGDDSDDV